MALSTTTTASITATCTTLRQIGTTVACRRLRQQQQHHHPHHCQWLGASLRNFSTTTTTTTSAMLTGVAVVGGPMAAIPRRRLLPLLAAGPCRRGGSGPAPPCGLRFGSSAPLGAGGRARATAAGTAGGGGGAAATAGRGSARGGGGGERGGSVRHMSRAPRHPDERVTHNHDRSQLSLLEKYMNAKQACEAMPATEVNPFGVFANNELNLSGVEVYGFDYDYTLAVYTGQLHYLIYDLGQDWLINKFKYPKGIGELEYRPGFAIRGLHYDIKEGILMKIDLFHQIQFESVYRGLTPLSRDEVERIYGGSYIPQYMIRAGNETNRTKQLNDLFSVPEICLISNVTEYFIKNNIAFNPEILFYDVQNAVGSIHPVIHNMFNKTNIGIYLEKYPELATFLQRLKDNGKKMFIVTNSPFKFLDVGMQYMLGDNWQDFFDVVIVQARKPKFFTEHQRPFRMYDKATKSQLWERVTKLEQGKVYVEGTVNQLQQMKAWVGHSVLYFGDQIYNDLADLTLNYGWRTGAILYELSHEIRISNSEEFRHTASWLQTLQHLIADMQDSPDIQDFIDTLLEERDLLRKTTKSLFNANFGSVFRTHHNPTYFSRRLFRYSDIYMSHVTNLMNYSLNHTFYPRRGVLPHESYIPHS